MANDMENLPLLKAGLILLGQSSCPIPSGSTGLWMDTNKNVFFRSSTGTDTAAGPTERVATGTDVASSGAGAQTTVVAQTGSTPTSGVYRIDMVISAHTNSDTVSMQVTFTDAVNSTASTLTPISSVALTHDNASLGTTNASVTVRASAATAIKCLISASTQTTTKASASITRLA